MTGYGVAFPRKSKHFLNFNRKVMEYSENGERKDIKVSCQARSILGDLERLRRFWLTGTCKVKKEEKRFSEPLAPEQVSQTNHLIFLISLLSWIF